MTMRKKLLITIACLSVILCTLITGTIAWLIDDTESIVNEFTPSNIDVDLTEDSFDGKMIPSKSIDKKAIVTVTNDIDCYVFIEVVKSTTLDTYIDYAVDTSIWTHLNTDGNKSVYYKEITTNGSTSYSILGAGANWAKDQVYVKPSVTKAQMKELIDGSIVQPTLSFKAYACQKEGFNDAAAAWAEASTQATP